MNRLIDNEFEDFAKVCFGNISPQQYIDLRRTFFGGAAALWKIVFENLAPGDEATPADLGMLTAIQNEMEQFSADVKAGRK